MVAPVCALLIIIHSWAACLTAQDAAVTLTEKQTTGVVTFSTQDDHRDMQTQLGIAKLRPGPSGDPKNPNAANTDESKANPYPKLPDLMTLKDGSKVTTRDQWWNQRRPEIVEDFEREVLGRIPKGVPEVAWKVVKTISRKLGETDVIEKRLVGRADNSGCPEIEVNILMSIVMPNNTNGRVPALMQFGFTSWGLDGEDINLGARRAGEPRPGSLPSKEQQLVEAGWAAVTINANSIQEDAGGEQPRRFGPPRPEGQTGGGLTRGIIGLTNKGRPRTPEQWGSLRAWAWGASRGLDYLQTEPSIDPTKVGIDGVSRYGKAALVTMAFDERFAAVLVGSSGEGGASLYRRNFGEAVENLTGSSEYHWMAGNFLKYGAAEASFGSKNANDLPVDAHMLIALCAPRLTFISYGVPEKGDALWLDQQGSFMATVAAQPAFRLLGAKDLGRSDDYNSEKMPPVNTELLDGELAWRQHDGGHTDLPNIPHFLKWANRLLEHPKANRALVRPTNATAVTQPEPLGNAEAPNAAGTTQERKRLVPLPIVSYPLGGDSKVDGDMKGKLEGPFLFKSKIIENTVRKYWIYVPPTYTSDKPAAVLVFQDGARATNPNGVLRVQNVLENLIQKSHIPTTIGIFITPGQRGEDFPDDIGTGNPNNRDREYDVLDDQYARFIIEEMLPEVGKKYNLTSDPALRAIGGSSSGAICAFTVAWHRPDQFRNVISMIGSFTNIHGGHVYPELILKEPKKPIRVFLQDGIHDLRSPQNVERDWYLQNQKMKAALAEKGYDFAFVLGEGGHSDDHGGAMLPQMLRWIWRDAPGIQPPSQDLVAEAAAIKPKIAEPFPGFDSSKSVNITGTWKWDRTIGPMRTQYTLKLGRDGRNISGTLLTQRGNEEPISQTITDVELMGNKIVFNANGLFRNTVLPTTYAAIVDDSKMVGWMMNEFGGSQRDTRWECRRE
jgi:enterochelin esterase-like enzyme